MTASATLNEDVNAGVHGTVRSQNLNSAFGVLKNFHKCVDGAETASPGAKSTVMVVDTRTLAASTGEDLDISGAFATMTKVHAIIVRAAASNTNDVVVGNAASNGFIGPFGGATHTVKVTPGETAVLSSRTGWTVTAATADLVHVLNGGSGTPVTYDIVVMGE